MNCQAIIESKVNGEIITKTVPNDTVYRPTCCINFVHSCGQHSGLLVSLLPPRKVVLSMWFRLNHQIGSINNSLGKVTAPKGVLQVDQYIFLIQQ